jgi:HPt (histidine-containing phosphotransfer) domain-containing protein
MGIGGGFDEFRAKPTDTSRLEEMLHRWKKKKKRGGSPGEGELGEGEPGENMAGEGRARQADQADWPQIPGLDIPGIDMRRGLALTGGKMAFYRQALAAFGQDARDRLPRLENAPQSNQALPGFVTQVHALKSAAASIGAAEISARAGALEAAGRAADLDFIRENLSTFAEHLAELVAGIEAWERALKERDAPEGAPPDQQEAARLWPELAAALKAKKARDIDRLLEELMRRPQDARARKALEKISEYVLLAEYGGAAEIVRSLVLGPGAFNQD